MVLAILIISFIASMISIIISKQSIIVSKVSIIVSIIRIIIHGSAPLHKQEILGMPTMYLKKHCGERGREGGREGDPIA